MQTQKRGLCAFDDKRFLLEDGIQTLTFGHRTIPTRVVEDNVEDSRIILSDAEAMARGLGGRPAAAVCKSIRPSRNLSDKQSVLDRLGFFVDNTDECNDDDDDDDDCDYLNEYHSNPFILSGVVHSSKSKRKRKTYKLSDKPTCSKRLRFSSVSDSE